MINVLYSIVWSTQVVWYFINVQLLEMYFFVSYSFYLFFFSDLHHLTKWKRHFFSLHLHFKIPFELWWKEASDVSCMCVYIYVSVCVCVLHASSLIFMLHCFPKLCQTQFLVALAEPPCICELKVYMWLCASLNVTTWVCVCEWVCAHERETVCS